MSKIEIDIRDNISANVALEAVRQVVANGKVSTGEKGKNLNVLVLERDKLNNYGNN